MPTIKITTSAVLSIPQKQDLVKEITSLGASIIGKPERVMQVIVSDGDVIAFGGELEPASAFVVVLSIGGLNPEVCRKLSAAFCDTLAEYGIPGDRVYLNFSEQGAEKWGHKGVTLG